MGCACARENKSKIIRRKSNQDIFIAPGKFVKINTQEFTKVYSVGRSLGTGTFGEVKFCTHLKTKSRRAVKIFNKKNLVTDCSKKKFQQEIDILKLIDHPNIVRTFEFFEDSSCFYIVMEHCRGGELFDEIAREKILTEPLIAQIMRQIFSCIAYLHSISIVHRDLKPENILFDEKSDYLNIKLIDFGSATMFDSRPLKESIGTPYYIAPEVLKQKYSEKCDMWSAGVILYTLTVGLPPFLGKDSSQILKAVASGVYNKTSERWEQASAELKDLIEHLLVPENLRLSAEEAMSHPWIKIHSSNSVDKSVLSQTFLNLSQFKNTNIIKDAVTTYITSQLMTSEEIRQAKEIFRALDENGDGKLSKDELISGFSKIMDKEKATDVVENILKQMGIEGDGFIEYSTFIKGAVDFDSLMSPKHLKNAFAMFDMDSNGKISANEIKKAMDDDNQAIETEWNEIIKLYDADSNGGIDLDGFKEILNNNVPNTK